MGAGGHRSGSSDSGSGDLKSLNPKGIFIQAVNLSLKASSTVLVSPVGLCLLVGRTDEQQPENLMSLTVRIFCSLQKLYTDLSTVCVCVFRHVKGVGGSGDTPAQNQSGPAQHSHQCSAVPR